MLAQSLPPRPQLLELAKAIVAESQPGVVLKGESTVLTNLAFGGLVAWVNEAFFLEKRTFVFSNNMILREFLDQVYRSDAEQLAHIEHVREVEAKEQAA